ncbi:hypothetical protein TNIN_218151 [Trichonephila inaurata madagascariensis]|uniref:Uncharacterized protein n=1 Tax=Trichonephila inaurata madagascariensis TaxID=2747483 RepID=A0A8X7BZ01_9ARAC|nr:hypothetical protein TNIN_218151 [Trichonephila inaurata madagascariensis]
MQEGQPKPGTSSASSCAFPRFPAFFGEDGLAAFKPVQEPMKMRLYGTVSFLLRKLNTFYVNVKSDQFALTISEDVNVFTLTQNPVFKEIETSDVKAFLDIKKSKKD